jgi:hypothetical protein
MASLMRGVRVLAIRSRLPRPVCVSHMARPFSSALKTCKAISELSGKPKVQKGLLLNLLASLVEQEGAIASTAEWTQAANGVAKMRNTRSIKEVNAFWDRFQEVMLERRATLKTKDLQLLMCSIAKAGRRPTDGLVLAVIEESLAKRALWMPEDSSKLLWALAKARVSVPVELAEALCEGFLDPLIKKTPQQISTVSWALVTAKMPLRANLVLALEQAAGRAIERFNAQDISQFFWAFATAGVALNRKLVRDFAARAVLSVQQFEPQNVSTLTWALAKLKVAARTCTHTVQRNAIQFNAPSTQHKSTCQRHNRIYFLQVRVDEEFFSVMLKHAANKRRDYSSEHISKVSFSNHF